MKTRKAMETKASILNAARELFNTQSVSKVSVSAIVEKAGVAKGTFYIYFESKDALVWEFIECQLGRANDFVLNIHNLGHTENDIESIIDYLIDFTKSNIKTLKMMHDVKFHGFLGEENMRAHYMTKWEVNIKKWLVDGNTKGDLDVSNPDFMARFLITAIHETFDMYIIDDADFTLEDARGELKSLLVKLLK